jgi:hypothetical protein
MADPKDNLIHITSETASELGRKGGLAKKGKKHINTWVQELLHDEDFKMTILQGYKMVEFKGAPIKAIIQAQITKAASGDTAAYKALFESGWAKRQEIDATVKQVTPIMSLEEHDALSGNDGNQES